MFYINKLADLLPESVPSSLFADDVGILATNRDRKKAEQEAQKVVDEIKELTRVMTDLLGQCGQHDIDGPMAKWKKCFQNKQRAIYNNICALRKLTNSDPRYAKVLEKTNYTRRDYLNEYPENKLPED